VEVFFPAGRHFHSAQRSTPSPSSFSSSPILLIPLMLTSFFWVTMEVMATSSLEICFVLFIVLIVLLFIVCYSSWEHTKYTCTEYWSPQRLCKRGKWLRKRLGDHCASLNHFLGLHRRCGDQYRTLKALAPPAPQPD